jgi:hypothetical protein
MRPAGFQATAWSGRTDAGRGVNAERTFLRSAEVNFPT